MRRSTQEITDIKAIEKIIFSCSHARMGMNREGSPYILPMNFGYKDRTFYFHCAGEGLKLDLLNEDPRVCVELDFVEGLKKDSGPDPCDWGMKYSSVIAVGTAVFIDDLPGKRAALKTIVGKFADPKKFSMDDQALVNTVVFKVSVEEITAKHSG
jgi:nitroimidazol reductase NimA-like FMN-containing flavoprotein (pyridoxamine 5'-phosphate oxidase superfamily)